MDWSEEVLEYDVNEAATIIRREDGISASAAAAKARALASTHPALFPVVRSWLRGGRPEFEFQGVTMTLIQEKKRGGYRDAIATMSWLLKNPNEVEWFKAHDFPVM